MLALAGALAAVGLVVLSPWSSDGERQGSVALDGDEPFEMGTPAAAYQVTYRVEEAERVSAERLTVRRPFESRLEVFATSDVDGDAETVEVMTFTRTARVAGGGRVAVAIPPALAAADVRIDAIVDDAIEAGVFEERERRRVLDRECQVYRTGQTLRLVELVRPADGAHTDVCIDVSGVVLEEVDVRDGEIDRRRIAVDLDVSPDLDADDLDAGDRTIPVEQGGGSVREVTPESRPPGPFLELGASLPLPLEGRFAVVPPQPDAFSDPLKRNERVGALTDVLRDGLDVVFIERGGTLGGVEVLPEAGAGTPVDVGPLGGGELVLTAYGAEITVDLGGGRYLRVSGTLPVEDLLTVARDLREVDGGTLTPIGERW